jgi:hypothetical protein
MNLFRIKKTKEDLLLLKNNQPAMCPHQNKILVPGRIQGSMDLQEFSCNSRCALFEYDKTIRNLKLHCSSLNVNDVDVEPENTMHLFSNGMANA